MGRGLVLGFLFLCLTGMSCGEDPKLGSPDEEVCMDRRNGDRFCIDVYEASRRDATSTEAGVDEEGVTVSLQDRLPWTEITWEGASTACGRKGKRLCSFDEWIDACDGTVGDGGRVFVYGDEVEATICNTAGGPIEPGGQRSGCISVRGTFDQNGNVWEWTGASRGAAAARGGSFRSSQAHRCDSTLPGAMPDVPNVEIGFRCCRDV